MRRPRDDGVLGLLLGAAGGGCIGVWGRDSVCVTTNVLVGGLGRATEGNYITWCFLGDELAWNRIGIETGG